jgi:cobalt-zinc-cadmium resistance protein CzcA
MSDDHMNVRILVILLITLLPASLAAQVRLDSLLQRIDNHPRVRAAKAAIDVQSGRKLQALSPPSPNLTFHEEEIPSGGSLGTGALREWQISQGFDIPLLIGARGYQYGHLRTAAEHRLTYTRMLLRAEIIAGYARWYSRTRQMKIHEENVRLAEEFARKADLRHKHGESSALEASRARAESATARIALEQARNAQQSAATELSLASATQLYSQSSPEMAAQPVDSLTSQNPDRLLALPDVRTEEMQHGPAIEAAREERDAAQANASWRWMEFLPRFEAAWFQQEFTDIGRHWGAELTASLPLWFLLDTRGSIEEHQAAQRIAEEEFILATREFGNRYYLARQGLQTAAIRMRAYDGDLLDEAKRIAQTSQAGYASGEIGYMEYISARQSANTISLGYYDALAELYTAIAQYELYTDVQILE